MHILNNMQLHMHQYSIDSPIYLSQSHYNGEHNWPKVFNRMEYEQLSNRRAN